MSDRPDPGLSETQKRLRSVDVKTHKTSGPLNRGRFFVQKFREGVGRCFEARPVSVPTSPPHRGFGTVMRGIMAGHQAIVGGVTDA